MRLTDAQGNQNTATYDSPGNLTQTKNTTTGATLSYTYNPATPTCGGKVGQMCTSVDGNSHTTTYGYDTSGNLTSITPPSPLGATSQTFDSLGRVATIHRRQEPEDDLQLRRRRPHHPGTHQRRHDLHLQRRHVRDVQLRRQRQPAYPARRHRYHHLRLRRPEPRTSKQLPSTATLSQTYDPAGNVATYVDAGGTVTYGYNAANQLTKLAEPGGSCTGTISLCTTFGYDNNGNRTTTTYPGNTVMTTTLDNAGRPTEVKTVTRRDHADRLPTTPTPRPAQRHRADRRPAPTRRALITTYGYDSRNDLTVRHREERRHHAPQPGPTATTPPATAPP